MKHKMRFFLFEFPVLAVAICFMLPLVIGASLYNWLDDRTPEQREKDEWEQGK